MGSLFAWFDQRLRLRAMREFLSHKRVPMHHHSIWYYLGGVTLFLFLVQVTSGVLLLLYYRPSPDAAFESVRFIVVRVPFGWLIRSVHAWAANLMVGAAFAHLFSVLFLKAYRSPRELTWMTGCLLMALTLAFGFSGYLLPWNELALFATKVGTDIVGATPVVGPWVRFVLRGGEDVSGATLTRFFGFHVALLPLMVTLLLIVHFALVQVHGISEPIRARSPVRHMPFYPHFVLREVLVWLGVLGVLVGLATLLPWEVGHKADPFSSAPAGIRPEWYFTFMSQTLKYLPPKILGLEGEHVGIIAFAAVALALFALPLLDRRAARGLPSPVVSIAGGLVLAFALVMTLLAYVRPY